MVSFVAISSVSAMVVRVIWRVARRIFCRVYVTYGTECVGIKVVKLWTISLKKLLDLLRTFSKILINLEEPGQGGQPT